MRFTAILLAVCLACALSPAQQTWIVDKFNRPGAQFTDIPQAVAAAAPGDILRVRATTLQPIDAYTAPTIQGKGLTILGETQPVRTLVGGGWTIRDVPASESVTIVGVQITGLDFPARPSFILCLSSPGAITLENVEVFEFGSAPFFYGGITDCNLVTVSRCNIAWGGAWNVLRSTLMINDSVMRSVTSSFLTWGSTLWLRNSRLVLARSQLFGSYSTPQFPQTDAPAVGVCGSTVVIGGGCLLQSGTTVGGGRLWSVLVSDCTNQLANLPSTIAVDLATTFAIGGWSGDVLLTYLPGPQTGLGYSITPTTLDVDQYTHAGALSVLAIGAVTTSPWTNLVGPVFVDPVGITDYWSVAATTAVLRRSFAIPPGLPLGTSVAMQAFELLPNGTFLTSNATIAGIW